MINFPMFQVVAKTLEGMENILADELNDLGAQDIEIRKRAVYFKADDALLYKVNYWSRYAISFLKPIASYKASNEEELYQGAFDIDWTKLFDLNKTFMVSSVVNNSNLTHSQYVALKVKDAIADRFRKELFKRPNVETREPNIRIHVYLSNNQCEISLDSSGAPLFKRGYRRSDHQAPLNEVLAAGMIKLSGWNFDCNFVDPMCGSGTLLIEAAMMANNIPAGYYRTDFSFLHWKDFKENEFKSMIADAPNHQQEFEHHIIGGDISENNLNLAMGNVKFARMHRDIELRNCDIRDFQPPKGEKGFVIMNPPYGERLKEDDLVKLYQDIGTALKKNFGGFTALIISSDLKAIRFIGLHPSRKINLLNGSLECKFQRYELYDGSRKTKFNQEH